MAVHDTARADEGWHRPRLAAGLVAAIAAAVATGVIALPRETAALPAIARHAMRIALPRWGTTEAVNEIVYGSRGFDTFGETFLLLAAVVAVVVLARGREPRAEYVGESSAGRSEQATADPRDGRDHEAQMARRAEQAESEDAEPAPEHVDTEPLGRPGPERAVGMTVIVRVSARIAAVPLAVAGVYQAAWGYTPGGGFPAGAVLTGVALLLYAALGHRAVSPVVRPDVLEPIEMLGAAAIVWLATMGLTLKGSFLQNWLPLAEQQTIRAGGTIQVFSGAEIIEVATGLTIAIFALLGMRHEWAPDEDES